MGQSCAISAGSARPINGSSGTARAIAIVRSTSSSSIFGERSLLDTIACRLPISTRSPRSRPSERSSFSVLPSRRACDSEMPSNMHSVGRIGPLPQRPPDQIVQQVDVVCRVVVDCLPGHRNP